MAALLAACDPPQDIGVVPLTPVGTFYTDTLTIRTSTVLADSVHTGNPDVFLMGKYQDPVLGKVTASSFTSVRLVGAQEIQAGAVYDSLVLRMGYSYTYGDTLPAQKMAVHRLTEVLSRTTSYYNNSSVGYESTPLATTSFNARPVSNNILRVKLPNTLGTELMTLLATTSNQTTETLQNALKGLAFIPDASNTAVVGFQGASVWVTLYYHNSSTDTTARSFFILTNYNYEATNQSPPRTDRAAFNRVTADRTGTPLEGIRPLTPIPAAMTNGLTYVHDALGIRTKIEIPYLHTLRRNGAAAINRAEIRIKPDQSLVKPGLGLPLNLVLLETDSTNRQYKSSLGYELIVNTDEAGYSETPAPQVATYSTRFQNYNFSITTQLQAILTGYKKRNSFLVTPVYTGNLGADGTRFESQMNNNVSRLAIGTQPEDVKLIVFYTVAQN
ncbi:DUF4270 family protein [Rhabdobacter roseus]|uniref:DUF4270 family protein n=1 Tax=Rhabdobacter roseus TaxID=1655419 RepID=A0A840TN27_9BACT|nr:DUF4270 family protein [Rhabdobacter roseus]MBB5284335.1 hypothetical protein [Rhabdobacter roseus]